mgnify:CR=1 FL=1
MWSSTAMPCWSGASEGRPLVLSVHRRGGRDDRPSATRASSVSSATRSASAVCAQPASRRPAARTFVSIQCAVLYRSPAGEPRVVRASLAAGRVLFAARLVPGEEPSTSRISTPVMAPWRADLTAVPPRVAPLVADADHRGAPPCCRPARPTRRASSSTLRCRGGRRRPGNRGSAQLPRDRACACSSRTRTNAGRRDSASNVRLSSGLGWSSERGGRDSAREAPRASPDGDNADPEAILRLERHVRLAGEDGRRRAA